LSLPGVCYTETKGAVVRSCPGTKHHICCGYKTIDLVEGCLLSCSYCILKDYLNGPGIRVHADIPYILRQVEETMEAEQEHIPRFGTGELSDSLALDRRLRLNGPLIAYFGEKRKGLLELKSKWAGLDHLRGVLNPYTVISFSLAPPRIIIHEEKRTSPLHKRLRALRKAQEWGCFVGLHFDPIVIYPGFEKDYEYLIDDVARILDLKKVIWVSLGLLRFMPKSYARFLSEGRKNLLAGEFVRGEDGKYRYIKEERIRVYRMIYRLLKGREEDLFIYLCMERSDIWERVTGSRLEASEELIRLFDKRIEQFYGGAL
jgi:spore photoproduct lyase